MKWVLTESLACSCHRPPYYSGSHRNQAQGMRPPPEQQSEGLGGRAVGDLHLRLSPLGHGRGLWMDVLLGWGAGLAGQDAPSGDPGDQASFLLGRLA